MFVFDKEDSKLQQIKWRDNKKVSSGARKQRKGHIVEEDTNHIEWLEAEGWIETSPFWGRVRANKGTTGHPLPKIRRGRRTNPIKIRSTTINWNLWLYQRSQVSWP